MKIIQFSPENRQYRNAFIKFPYTLYKDDPYWVPTLRKDMRKIFKPNYPFYGYGEAAFFLALDQENQVLGRLAVANNHRLTTFINQRQRYFITSNV